MNPKVYVHAAKLKVDGITKYLDNTQFKFDHVRCCCIDISAVHSRRQASKLRVLANTSSPCGLVERFGAQSFGEEDTNDDIYTYVVQPLVHFMFRRGRGTVFAYGQTGSGKTYTMVRAVEVSVYCGQQQHGPLFHDMTCCVAAPSTQSGIQRMAAEDIFHLLGSRELRYATQWQ